MLSFKAIGAALAATVVLLFLKRICRCRSMPLAPGCWLAKWTDLWYAYQVSGGCFEQWNINAHRSWGKIVRVGPGSYSIDDPAAMDKMYGISSRTVKSSWYDAWGDPRVSNHNLFSARDPKVHAEMRRAVASMYSMSTIKSYEPYVDSCIQVLLDRLDRFAVNGQIFDIRDWMQRYAFDVIGEISFGERVGFLDTEENDIDGILQALDNSLHFSTFGGIQPLLAPFLFVFYGNPVKGLRAFATKLKDQSQWRKHRDGAQTFAEKIDLLREQDATLFERFNIKDITLTGNIAAGSDTTSISLTSALYYIATTKGVAQKLQNEVETSFPRCRRDERIPFDEAQKLPYLRLVIKEALRLHPAVGLPLWREVREEGITIADQVFPQGAVVGVNPWVAHANADVFGKDAHEFRPERWNPSSTAPEQLARMEKYYIPFGSGTRTCIGRHIAQIEMVKVIPELIRRYDFESIKEELEHTNCWFVKPDAVDFRLRIRQ